MSPSQKEQEKSIITTLRTLVEYWPRTSDDELCNAFFLVERTLTARLRELYASDHEPSTEPPEVM